MEHQYYTSRRKDERRAWLPIVIVVVLVVGVLGGLWLAFGNDGPAESGGSLPSLLDPVPTAAPTTLAPATLPPVATAPVTGPPAVTTDEPDETAGSDETVPDDGSSNPREALRDLADETNASIVTDVVAMGSARFAMIVVGGDAELYRWTGSAWERETVLGAPASVSDIDAADVTDDGVQDFLITLSGLRDQGGVFSRATFNFELLPFNTTSGQEEWVDDLDLTLGRLTSEVDDGGNRTTVEWTWTGNQFEVL